jgi:hypothetical protein
MDNAVSVLTEFSLQAPLTLVTARPTKEPIAEWLHSVLGDDVYRRVKLIATGEHDGKFPFIKNAGLSAFIDDRAPTCIQLAEKGVQSIVFCQPWNEGKHCLPSVDSWLSIKDLCITPDKP